MALDNLYEAFMSSIDMDSSSALFSYFVVSKVKREVKNRLNIEDAQLAEDLTGPLQKQDIISILNDFFRKQEVRALASQEGR